jgi:hypothetical protein
VNAFHLQPTKLEGLLFSTLYKGLDVHILFMRDQRADHQHLDSTGEGGLAYSDFNDDKT